jgi:hypothetical protein
MNDQDHSLSLSDPDRSLVLSHLLVKLVNFLKNLVSCQTSLTDALQLDFIRFFIKMSQLLFVKYFYFFKTFQKTNNIFIQQCLEK